MIPTAEEFLSDNTDRVAIPWIDNDIEDNSPLAKSILTCMIEFTKLHLQAQQEAILSRLRKKGVDFDEDDWNFVTSAYNINLVK